jgi:hypothetical protein
MATLAKQANKGLLYLAELSQQAAVIGEMGEEYNQRYLHKGEYWETPENWNTMGYELHGSSKVLL